MNHSATCFQDPRNILAYARAAYVEQIMALYGRASADPKRYRRLLESMDIPALQRALDEPPIFPAPEEPGTHARPRAASIPARETLTLQSCLP